MKKVFAFILTILMCILSGCSSTNQTEISNESCSIGEVNYSKYDVRNYIPNYERYVCENNEITLAIISDNSVEWLYLSLDEYADDRLKIKEYEHELIKALENISPQRLPLKIAIDEYDVNNDGVEEIIAFHNGDGGAKDAGVLMVYFQNQKKESIISSIRVVGVADIDILNNQGLGVIPKEEGTIDFIILNKLYIWDGTSWN